MKPQFEDSRNDMRVDDHTGRPSTSRAGMNATARDKKLILENKSSTWETASTTTTRKKKLLFAKGFKSNSPVSTGAEFINSCQNEKIYISMLGFYVEN